MNLPLFVVTGCSGSGKSTIAQEIGKLMREYAVFDMDLLVINNDYRTASLHWLNISGWISTYLQKHTILFGNVPNPYNLNIEGMPTPFANIHYLHLYCSSEVRIKRLLERGWPPEKISEELYFADFVYTQSKSSSPPIPIVDTSLLSVADATLTIYRWIVSTTSQNGG